MLPKYKAPGKASLCFIGSRIKQVGKWGRLVGEKSAGIYRQLNGGNI